MLTSRLLMTLTLRTLRSSVKGKHRERALCPPRPREAFRVGARTAGRTRIETARGPRRVDRAVESCRPVAGTRRVDSAPAAPRPAAARADRGPVGVRHAPPNLHPETLHTARSETPRFGQADPRCV